MKKRDQRKQRSQRKKKLGLSRETVKKLDVDDLRVIRGGERDSPGAPGISKCTCW